MIPICSCEQSATAADKGHAIAHGALPSSAARRAQTPNRVALVVATFTRPFRSTLGTLLMLRPCSAVDHQPLLRNMTIRQRAAKVPLSEEPGRLVRLAVGQRSLPASAEIRHEQSRTLVNVTARDGTGPAHRRRQGARRVRLLRRLHMQSRVVSFSVGTCCAVGALDPRRAECRRGTSRRRETGDRVRGMGLAGHHPEPASPLLSKDSSLLERLGNECDHRLDERGLGRMADTGRADPPEGDRLAVEMRKDGWRAAT